MSFHFISVLAMMAFFSAAVIFAEFRLRVLTGRLNARVEGFDSRMRGLKDDQATASQPKNRPAMTVSSVQEPPRSATRRFDPLESSVFGGPTLIAIPNIAAKYLSIDTTSSDDLEGRYGEIWDFGDRGASPEQIARESGLPKGQVELILGLRRLTKATNAGTNGHDEQGASVS